MLLHILHLQDWTIQNGLMWILQHNK